MVSVFSAMARSLCDKVRAARDPVGFARSLGVQVGRNVRFYGVNRAMFGSEPWLISIGDNCFITAGVQFVNHDGGTLILRKVDPTLEWTAPILIGNDVYLGIRSIVLPNVRIGSQCIVGAGSVVTKDVPDGSVVAGVPARVICTTEDYLGKMQKKSLGFGGLSGDEKARAISEHYRSRGWFQGDD